MGTVRLLRAVSLGASRIPALGQGFERKEFTWKVLLGHPARGREVKQGRGGSDKQLPVSNWGSSA